MLHEPHARSEQAAALEALTGTARSPVAPLRAAPAGGAREAAGAACATTRS